ncbi:rhamnan synthesis F family protein [Seohaeicola saemankumensis]|uniref:Rhamnan synthesis F family protein n=1 Tax=Seohaeicola saemankumensis TaxID=481181 RepID=A0ABW3TBI4_9RHOB
MTPIRMWKLKRELRRLVPKTFETLAEPFRFLTFVPLYDLRKSRLMRISQGALMQSDEVAIYLIYAPQGVQASHHHMLSEMLRAGISPIVVSNLPLSDADRDSLRQQTFRVIERPNVGYDFGGYRDGILSIVDLLPRLDRLWILNDSAWLVDQSPSWFNAARALGKDFVGSVSKFGIRKVDVEDHGRITWEIDHGHRKYHLASNTWSLGPAILRDPGFMTFWKRLQIRDSKYYTVRRGEIGFSRWVIDRGFSHGTTLSVETLDVDLARLDDDELDAVTKNLLVLEERLEPTRGRVLQIDRHSEAGRRARISLCLATTARHGSIVALPFYNLTHEQLHFFKKSVLNASESTARTALGILQLLPGQTGEMIRHEALAMATRIHGPIPEAGPGTGHRAMQHEGDRQ